MKKLEEQIQIRKKRGLTVNEGDFQMPINIRINLDLCTGNQ